MTDILQSQIFFFISSVGFVILFLLLAILFAYAIRTFYTVDRILRRLEKNVGVIGDGAEEMLEDVRESTVYRLLLGGRSKRKR